MSPFDTVLRTFLSALIRSLLLGSPLQGNDASLGLPVVVYTSLSQGSVFWFPVLLAWPLIASPPPDGLVLRTATQATSCLPALDVRIRYGSL